MLGPEKQNVGISLDVFLDVGNVNVFLFLALNLYYYYIIYEHVNATENTKSERSVKHLCKKYAFKNETKGE